MPALKLATVTAFAILRFAYNQIGDNIIAAGIGGSAFFVDKKTALTATHIFRDLIPGFQNQKYWLISRSGKVIPIKEEFFTHHPELDVTVINFPNNQVDEAFELSEAPPIENTEVCFQGYVSKKPPYFKFEWNPNGVNILEADVTDSIIEKHGAIKSIGKIDFFDHGKYLGTPKMIELSFDGVRGMSGGPLIRESDSKVIGLVSSGLPQYSEVKDVVYAISVDEMRKKLFGTKE